MAHTADDHAPSPRRRGLVQAPVKPLDEDGVQVAALGTLVWAVASVVLLVRGDASPDWWLWTALFGTVIGMLGLGYCLRRKRARGGAGGRPPQTTQSNRT